MLQSAGQARPPFRCGGLTAFPAAPPLRSGNSGTAAIRQAIAKSIVAFYQKYVDEASKKQLKDILLTYDRTLLVADPRRCEPKKCVSCAHCLGFNVAVSSSLRAGRLVRRGFVDVTAWKALHRGCMYSRHDRAVISASHLPYWVCSDCA